MSVMFDLQMLPVLPPETIVQVFDPEKAALCEIVGHAFEGRIAMVLGDGVRCVGACVHCGMGGISTVGEP